MLRRRCGASINTMRLGIRNEFENVLVHAVLPTTNEVDINLKRKQK